MANLSVRDAVEAFFMARDLAQQTVERYQRTFDMLERYTRESDIKRVGDVDVLFLRQFARWLRDEPRANGRKLATSTVTVHVNILRAFVHFCVREGWMDADVLLRWESPRRAEPKPIAVLTRAHITRLYDAARATRHRKLAQRNVAILSALLDSGMRVSELTGLCVGDVISDGRNHRTLLRVQRKGDKEQNLILGKRASTDVFRYRVEGRPLLLDDDEDMQPFFLTQYGTRLRRRDVEKLFDTWVKHAGREHFKGIRVSPHTCRHSMATAFLEGGGDIYTLKLLLNHQSVTVTERYVRTVRERAGQQHSVLDRLMHVILPKTWTGSYVREAEGIERGEATTYEPANRTPEERTQRETTSPAA